ncbi:MAG: phosphoribosylaminoimidazolesuccinocarboxamide synthase [Candidatus Izemoplasmatales bacterium]|jgi:phosphoribosylaminoimidazole-succinocarboxamide synthase|nr:phosphoribosylaminoimidazolesuccinocarboxamide synthase [Candidatus Izemoplasmatales bacterium]
MDNLTLIYEGKAKKVYSTENPNEVIIYYKDDATAFNGVKKANIADKGILNNQISEILFIALENAGIPSHFIKRIDERSQLCKKVEIIKVEAIVRNVIAGSMAKRLQIPEGTIPKNTIIEICYKNDELGDPLINDHHAVALNICSYEELDTIYAMTRKINEVLTAFFLKQQIRLIDFKVEFGRTSNGEIILADEISPDTCRLWDLKTNEKLDKDRFRRDLGNVKEAYIEILTRIK